MLFGGEEARLLEGRTARPAAFANLRPRAQVAVMLKRLRSRPLSTRGFGMGCGSCHRQSFSRLCIGFFLVNLTIAEASSCHNYPPLLVACSSFSGFTQCSVYREAARHTDT